MRNKNSNEISNAWKKVNSANKQGVNNSILQQTSTSSRSGMDFRNGQFESGAVQLFNLDQTTNYIMFGGNSGGGTTVGP